MVSKTRCLPWLDAVFSPMTRAASRVDMHDIDPAQPAWFEEGGQPVTQVGGQVLGECGQQDRLVIAGWQLFSEVLDAMQGNDGFARAGTAGDPGGTVVVAVDGAFLGGVQEDFPGAEVAFWEGCPTHVRTTTPMRCSAPTCAGSCGACAPTPPSAANIFRRENVFVISFGDRHVFGTPTCRTSTAVIFRSVEG
nr:hypothetical protein [Nocardia sp. CNY236]